MGIISIKIEQTKSFFRWLFNQPEYCIEIDTELSEEMDKIFDWFGQNFGSPISGQWRFSTNRWYGQSGETWAIIYLYSHDDITLFKLTWMEEIGKIF